MLEKDEKIDNQNWKIAKNARKMVFFGVGGGKEGILLKLPSYEKLQNTIWFRKVERRHFRWHYLFWENVTFGGFNIKS